MNHLFGPVLSRRLGLSLGVDLLPLKSCNLDCIYCEIGCTRCPITTRGSFYPKEEILREIRRRSGEEFDHLTFAGSGEPTLSSSLGEVIRKAREMIDRPVAVITNSTLLTDEAVRDEVAEADLVLPSLDAATQRTFEIVNRPAPGLHIDEIMAALRKFREEFDGEIWLEVMLVKDINDFEAPLIADAAESIGPDRIQLNTVVRPPAEPVLALTKEEMLEMLDVFPGAELIPDWDWRVPGKTGAKLLDLLSRRPCTLDEIESLLDLDMEKAVKYLKILEDEGRVSRRLHERKLYFVVP